MNDLFIVFTVLSIIELIAGGYLCCVCVSEKKRYDKLNEKYFSVVLERDQLNETVKASKEENEVLRKQIDDLSKPRMLYCEPKKENVNYIYANVCVPREYEKDISKEQIENALVREISKQIPYFWKVDEEFDVMMCQTIHKARLKVLSK